MKTAWGRAARLVLAASIMAACQTSAGGAGGSTTPGACLPEAAEALTGMDRLTDRQAMKLTGATEVRQIATGQVMFMDYRRKRVTIETDPGTGKITRASCG